MNRFLILLICVVFAVASSASAEKRQTKLTRTKKSTVSGTSGITDIRNCPDEGIGGDPNLNRRKNVRADKRRATMHTFQWMQSLKDPTGFTPQSASRAPVERLGEGKKITVVAYALVARVGGKESCNCGLKAPKDTDNHIVLVDPTLKQPTLAADEPESETAEFTPRVRLDLPNLSRANLQPLIAKKGRLLVRVTGQLMFDSEHFFRNHLKRHNNWEIHPVMALEYCAAATCQETGNTGWKNLGD
jgi:hypothetical protein